MFLSWVKNFLRLCRIFFLQYFLSLHFYMCMYNGMLFYFYMSKIFNLYNFQTYIHSSHIFSWGMFIQFVALHPFQTLKAVSLKTEKT
jgi:hypothetical protein